MKTLFSLVAAVLVLTSQAALAYTIAAVTEANRLITFDHSAPGEILNDVAITGLNAMETIVGIDVRPLTGVLFAISNQSRVVTLNPNTGVVTAVTTLTTPLDVSATDFGVDFNPAADRLRIVSNTGQNLRFNPNDNATAPDTTLAYVTGDANEGNTPGIVDVAYDRNDQNGGTPTTLFVIESNLYGTKALPDSSTVPSQVLVRIGDVDGTPNLPNTGQLHTVASVGIDGLTFRGLDVSPDADAVFAGVLLPNASPEIAALLRIDLATGEHVSLGYIGDGSPQIVDLAVIPSVQLSSSLYANSEGFSVGISVTRSGGLSNTATVNYATYNGTASGADYTVSSAMTSFIVGDSNEIIFIPLTNDAIPEGDETFLVVLFGVAGPANPALGRNSTATVRINANDFTDKAGPKVVHFGLIGSSRSITGAVIEFDEALNPAAATNLASYTLIVRGKPKLTLTANSGVYDPVTRTVTLGFAAPFSLVGVKKLTLTINGKEFGVSDTSGNLLDGDFNGVAGGNAVLMSAAFSGKTSIKFKERDGDTATLLLSDAAGTDLTGAFGVLDGLIPQGKKGPAEMKFWIVDPIPLESRLTGTVTPAKKGNGTVAISEAVGLGEVDIASFLENPDFWLDTLTFGNEATGK